MSFPTAFFSRIGPYSGPFLEPVQQIFHCRNPLGFTAHLHFGWVAVTSSGAERKEELAHSFFLPQCIAGNASENGRDPLAFPSRCGYSQMAPRAGNLTAVGTDNPHGETKMQNQKHPLRQTIFLMALEGACK